MRMILGLDIDGTITADPEFFAKLTERVIESGGEVHIVSSRSRQSYNETIAELASYGLICKSVYLLPSINDAQQLCPHQNLDWYQKHLWLKVDYAIRNGITHFVEDDPKVLELLARYAPEIEAIHVDNRHLISRLIQAV